MGWDLEMSDLTQIGSVSCHLKSKQQLQWKRSKDEEAEDNEAQA